MLKYKNKCSVCDSRSVKKINHSASLYKCKSCSHKYTVVSKEQYEAYDDDYYDSKSKNWFANPNYKLFDFILSKIPKKNGIRLLDVGCGNGDFLRYARKKRKDIELYGIDLLENKAPGITFIQGDIYGDNTKIQGTFDVVVSLGVIEHMDDLHIFIKKIKSKLSKGGKAIIMTIDSSSLMFKIAEFLNAISFSVPFERLYEPKHLNHFTKNSLRTLMLMHGFTVNKHTSHNYPFKAIDVPDASKLMQVIYKLSVISIFIVSDIFRNQILQTIVCEK